MQPAHAASLSRPLLLTHFFGLRGNVREPIGRGRDPQRDESVIDSFLVGTANYVVDQPVRPPSDRHVRTQPIRLPLITKREQANASVEKAAAENIQCPGLNERLHVIRRSNADRHNKLLIHRQLEGSRFGAYSHAVAVIARHNLTLGGSFAEATAGARRATYRSRPTR
jgi:hypothetical protein